jgi:hypothetical protein
MGALAVDTQGSSFTSHAPQIKGELPVRRARKTTLATVPPPLSGRAQAMPMRTVPGALVFATVRQSLPSTGPGSTPTAVTMVAL